MNKYIFIFLILWQIIPTQGQTTEGHVMEAVGESTKPLPGANVVQLNTTNGTVTDASGHFELKLISESPKILVISYISYQSDTVDLSKLKHNHVHVVLSSVKNLSEVEITSRQGAFLSRTATRNITEINQAELQKAACCNLSESFENSAAVDVSYSDAVTGAKQIQLLGLAGIYTQFLTENIPNMRGLATPLRTWLCARQLDGVDTGVERYFGGKQRLRVDGRTKSTSSIKNPTKATGLFSKHVRKPRRKSRSQPGSQNARDGQDKYSPVGPCRVFQDKTRQKR